MEMVKWIMPQEILMKVNGSMIKNQDLVLWTGLIKIKSMKDSGLKIYSTVMEHIFGLMEKFNIRLLKTFTKETGLLA